MNLCQLTAVLSAAGLAQAPELPAPAPSETTVQVEAGKSVRITVAAPPYGNRPKEWPLLRIWSAKYDQPATVTLNGSIMTAATVDYRITATLLAQNGKAIATASTIEHVRHIELGRVLTVMRTWKLDFGKLGATDLVKSVRLRVREVVGNTEPLSPQVAVDTKPLDTATVVMDVVRTGWTDGINRPGEDQLGPMLVDPDIRLRDGARFQAVIAPSAIRQWNAARDRSEPTSNRNLVEQIASEIRGRRVHLTGLLTRDPIGGEAAGPALWILVVDRGEDIQVVK